MERILKTGTGWRIGWDPTPRLFQGLIGGEDWAVELTADEFQDFCRLFMQLIAAIAAITPELMDEEQLECEVESEQIWLEAFGDPQAYSIRMILNQGRGAEGTWPASTIPELRIVVQDFLSGMAVLSNP